MQHILQAEQKIRLSQTEGFCVLLVKPVKQVNQVKGYLLRRYGALGGARRPRNGQACIRQQASAYVGMRQHTSAYDRMHLQTPACVSIRQHTLAYVSIRQHASAYVSIRYRALEARSSDAMARPGVQHVRICTFVLVKLENGVVKLAN